MKNLKSKTSATAIALLIMASLATSFTIVNAHSPAWQIPTYAYISVAPNPVGVGQTVTVGFWLNQPPPDAGGPYGDRWDNMKVTVTHPDGAIHV
jgi:hypothetical protein